jgi:hypothetical protein
MGSLAGVRQMDIPWSRNATEGCQGCAARSHDKTASVCGLCGILGGVGEYKSQVLAERQMTLESKGLAKVKAGPFIQASWQWMPSANVMPPCATDSQWAAVGGR